MPSGDTTQAAQFMAFVSLYLPNLYELLGGYAFAAGLVFIVASARVFYHCHFYGDTIVGAVLGVMIANMLYQINVSSAVGFVVDLIPFDLKN